MRNSLTGRCILLCAVALLLAPRDAMAVDWANTSTAWGTGSNWVGGNVPTSSEIAALPNVVSGKDDPTIGASSFSVLGITIDDSGQDYSIGGSSGILTIGSSGISLTGTGANSSSTITANVALGASQTWTVANVSNANILTMSGSITGAFNLTKDGAGTLRFSTGATYSGDTNIQNGTLGLVGSNNRLPSGTTVNLGQASSTNKGTLDMTDFNHTIAGLNSVPGSGGAGDNTVTTSSGSSVLTLGGASTYSYGDGTDANSGIITAGGVSIIKSGAGVQSFGDANTYGGGTSVTGGKLFINNSSGSGTGTGLVTVSIGGTLGGTGSFSGSVDVSGTLSPGTDTTSIESLAVANATAGTPTLTFLANSTFAYQIDSSVSLGPDNSAADRINVGGNAATGNVTIGSTVTLSLSDIAGTDQTLAVGTRFTLIAYGGALTGTFNGIAEGSVVSVGTANAFTINYANTLSGDNFTSGNTGDLFVTLTAVAVPEPGAILFGVVVCSLTGLASFRRNRRVAERGEIGAE